MAISGTAERLMDLAEQRMRDGGYHGFSFRDLANEIGITSASVHHHFPTKSGMVVAIMQRYRDRFAKLVERAGADVAIYEADAGERQRPQARDGVFAIPARRHDTLVGSRDTVCHLG